MAYKNRLQSEHAKILVWNPYLGQTRWIEPIRNFQITNQYALGHDSNGNQKILKFSDCRKAVFKYEIYDFSSDSWKRFGQRLPLPCHTLGYPVTLSCVREEQLAVLYLKKTDEIMEIWVTNTIESNSVVEQVFEASSLMRRRELLRFLPKAKKTRPVPTKQLTSLEKINV
ncbi:unnamed protein product [Brassica oleracea var. botrytis]